VENNTLNAESTVNLELSTIDFNNDNSEALIVFTALQDLREKHMKNLMQNVVKQNYEAALSFSGSIATIDGIMFDLFHQTSTQVNLNYWAYRESENTDNYKRFRESTERSMESKLHRFKEEFGIKNHD